MSLFLLQPDCAGGECIATKCITQQEMIAHGNPEGWWKAMGQFALVLLALIISPSGIEAGPCSAGPNWPTHVIISISSFCFRFVLSLSFVLVMYLSLDSLQLSNLWQLLRISCDLQLQYVLLGPTSPCFRAFIIVRV